MILNSSDFSDFEFCGRLPKLKKDWEPPRWKVREAVERYFERGLRYLTSGIPDAAMIISQEFLMEAGERGYQYPQGEPYVLAQDYASWLDGALRIIPQLDLQPLPLLGVEDHYVQVDGYAEGNHAHIFRVSHDFDTVARWPEMMLFGHFDPITVHLFKLPTAAAGRLCSPLSMAYRHPMTGGLRISRLEGEQKAFNQSWKRVGRWELEASWEEWMTGIEKDQCLKSIYRSHEYSPDINPDVAEESQRTIRRDMSHIISAIDKPQPRKREFCRSCSMIGLCHGSAEERNEYVKSNGENLQEMRSVKSLVSIQ